VTCIIQGQFYVKNDCKTQLKSLSNYCKGYIITTALKTDESQENKDDSHFGDSNTGQNLN
jgi:hypothetical protein